MLIVPENLKGLWRTCDPTLLLIVVKTGFEEANFTEEDIYIYTHIDDVSFK